MNILKGNTASLCLNNWGGIVIQIDDNGDYVRYQYQWGDENNSEIEESEIEYYEDNDNATGYAEDEDGLLQAGFMIGDQVYFLGEFMRDSNN